tara:strand:+ start:162561 stop:162884 length:324 start_codon:yes stop_codon:yes gene_type:complete
LKSKGALLRRVFQIVSSKRREKKDKRKKISAFWILEFVCWKLPFFVPVPKLRYREQKMASYLHHTATTVYPCCVPALGDSTGAGCVGLAAAKIRLFEVFASIFTFQF